MAAEYLNRGMYDVVEVAELLGRSPETIVSWTTPGVGQSPLLTPEHGDLFSFLDLVSLDVASRLRRRGIPRAVIERAARFLGAELSTSRPLAHARLATAGSQVFASLALEDESEWVDAGRWGQRAFQEMLVDDLRPFDFGPDELARRWHPRPRVVVDPSIQAGAPCIRGTRVPTRLVWDLRKSGLDLADIADDYELPIDDVRAAVDWERGLHEVLAA